MKNSSFPYFNFKRITFNQSILYHQSLFFKLSLFLAIFFNSSIVKAQIVPDNTLGSESSTIESIDELRDRIEGGAIRGENLFHSFEEFSIPEGLEVYFANPEGINNIFSRITGNNISEIFGTLGVEGVANLFLINPNGIVFGENARIDVGGSFIATTAERIHFEDGKVFKARNRERPLLTWNAPIGLDMGNKTEKNNSNTGTIEIHGSGHTLEDIEGGFFSKRDSNTGLTVLPTMTLALVGKEIKFNGGILTSPSGKIEIASVNQGMVEMTHLSNTEKTWTFNYENVEAFGDVIFATRSLLEVSSIPGNLQFGGGTIIVQGKNIFSQDGSVILNQNFGNVNSGSIQINASESFQVSGTDPIAGVQGGIRTENLSEGDGGDIFIVTPKFIAVDGASIGTISYSPFVETRSGNIVLNTSELQILGASPLSPISVSNIATYTFNNAKAGNIEVNTNTLSIKDGGLLASSGIIGAVGNIEVNATEYVEIIDFQPLSFVSSAILAINSLSRNPGEIIITTPNLYIKDGAGISTSTFALGSAGDISIDTSNLVIEGEITDLNDFDFNSSSNISSSASLPNDIILELLPDNFVIENLLLEGNAGNISLITNNLTIRDRASVTVQNDGTGNAGSINISANSINLDTGGSINGAAVLGEGGNISLKSDRITLNSSSISASANSEGGNISVNASDLDVSDSRIEAESLSSKGGNITVESDSTLFQNSNLTASAANEGNGGNVTIDADTVLGLNSDITATAFEGDGGNILIDADAVIGLPNEKPTRITLLLMLMLALSSVGTE